MSLKKTFGLKPYDYEESYPELKLWAIEEGILPLNQHPKWDLEFLNPTRSVGLRKMEWILCRNLEFKKYFNSPEL